MDNLALSQGGNLALASGALAIGTTTSTIKTTVAIPYTVDGKFLSKAITDNIAIAYTGPSVFSNGAVGSSNGSFTGGATGSTRLYGLYMDAAGTVTIEPGPIVDTAQLAAGAAALHFAPMKRANVCFGALRVALTVGTTFVPNTTLLGAAGVTASFLNLSAVPGEPLTS